MTKAKSLMVWGTASGVGKSFVAAGLCRLFSDWGYKVAPFKAQNMSNNSYVTDSGGEIGRAQAVQAECARVKPTVDMNPILLKPAADNNSQVVMHGKAVGHYKAREYFSQKDMMKDAIEESYERLASQYDILVMEGAGSPAEVNLRPNDLANLFAAQISDAKCLLVSDIDRGGVFASLIGTVDLLRPVDRKRLVGLVVNKFRGDKSLFKDGIKFIEEKTKKKIWGVLPYDKGLWIEEEDAMSLESSSSSRVSGDSEILDIAVIALPRMSNFTDFEVFKQEPGVRLRYVKRADDIQSPDLLILPGTKATIADLLYLMENGFREAIQEYGETGGRILGICGGYQMLGETITDPSNIESRRSKMAGLGFFKMTTEFHPEKILKRSADQIDAEIFGKEVSGPLEAYEIHMGVTRHEKDYEAFGRSGAVHPNGNIIGTYYHGLFDSGAFRKSFLNALAKSAGKKIKTSALSVQAIKEVHYTQLRKMMEKSLDVKELRKALGLGKAPSAMLKS